MNWKNWKLWVSIISVVIIIACIIAIIVISQRTVSAELKADRNKYKNLRDNRKKLIEEKKIVTDDDLEKRQAEIDNKKKEKVALETKKQELVTQKITLLDHKQELNNKIDGYIKTSKEWNQKQIDFCKKEVPIMVKQ